MRETSLEWKFKPFRMIWDLISRCGELQGEGKKIACNGVAMLVFCIHPTGKGEARIQCLFV